MARARNIKPGFFANPELVELPFATRLLFIGLWTVADRAGRMEDRPKKIKMSVFPADDVDVDAGLNDLQNAGFLSRYEHEGMRYIQILAFDKHQHPHKDEKASTIPAPCLHGASTVQESGEQDGNPPDSPIPDSLQSDSGLQITESAPDQVAKPSAEYSPEFEIAWSMYPQRPGANKKKSYKAWNARLKSGVDFVEITLGVERYAHYCEQMKIEPQFVKQPETFFGPDDHYKADWTVRPQARGSPGFKTANEKQKETADLLTGKARHDQQPDFIDIN